MNQNGDLLDLLADGWHGRFSDAEPFAGGAVNGACLVQTANGAMVAKRARLSPASAAWQAALLTFLAANGLAVPELLPSVDGPFVRNGVILMTYVVGGPIRAKTDWDRARLWLDRLHALTARYPQRPGAVSVSGFVRLKHTPKLAALPEDVRTTLLRAWDGVRGTATAVIHGDPNADNFVLTDTGPVLVDWEEARVDYTCLDTAGLPGADRASRGYTAGVAWEAFLFWDTNRDYSLRRLSELATLL